eukprot:GHVS01017466.1.p1 GENE.GHVS01017466.1~~GHVS01017466.1.p1  ORF type:complete len:693 (-),score=166.16 GHVS01017466.1:667-2745(-)
MCERLDDGATSMKDREKAEFEGVKRSLREWKEGKSLSRLDVDNRDKCIVGDTHSSRDDESTETTTTTTATTTNEYVTTIPNVVNPTTVYSPLTTATSSSPIRPQNYRCDITVTGDGATTSITPTAHHQYASQHKSPPEGESLSSLITDFVEKDDVVRRILGECIDYEQLHDMRLEASRREAEGRQEVRNSGRSGIIGRGGSGDVHRRKDEPQDEEDVIARNGRKGEGIGEMMSIREALKRFSSQDTQCSTSAMWEAVARESTTNTLPVKQPIVPWTVWTGGEDDSAGVIDDSLTVQTDKAQQGGGGWGVGGDGVGGYKSSLDADEYLRHSLNPLLSPRRLLFPGDSCPPPICSATSSRAESEEARRRDGGQRRFSFMMEEDSREGGDRRINANANNTNTTNNNTNNTNNINNINSQIRAGAVLGVSERNGDMLGMVRPACGPAAVAYDDAKKRIKFEYAIQHEDTMRPITLNQGGRLFSPRLSTTSSKCQNRREMVSRHIGRYIGNNNTTNILSSSPSTSSLLLPSPPVAPPVPAMPIVQRHIPAACEELAAAALSSDERDMDETLKRYEYLLVLEPNLEKPLGLTDADLKCNISGVYWDRRSWLASWYEHGKRHYRSFSAKAYGFYRSKFHAIKIRLEKQRMLKGLGMVRKKGVPQLQQFQQLPQQQQHDHRQHLQLHHTLQQPVPANYLS